MSQRSVRRERSSPSSSRRPASITNKKSGNDQNQPPVYCVVNPSPLIISSENQPRLTKLTEKPVYLYHAGGPGNNSPQSDRNKDQSNIYSPIPNSSGNVQYPLGHLNLSNLNSPDVTIRKDSDSRSSYSVTDSRSNVSFSQVDSRSEVSNVDSRIDEETKDERPRKRKSQRPWRGYVVEEEEKEKNFQSVGFNEYYIQEAISDSDTAVSISSATEKLLNLHIKFAAHRKFIDDGRPIHSREEVDPAIPYNEPVPKADECECDAHQKRIGVHHDIFPKEAIPRCDPYSNNANLLYHYRLIITPETNFVTRDPTTIYYDGKDFWFEGYSIFTHVLIDEIPPYTFTRNFIDYTVRFIKVDYIPSGFCIKDLDIVSDYFFDDIMELLDWNRDSLEKHCCRRFHFMPRFVHRTQDLTTEPPREVSEILSMGEVMQYLIESCTAFTEREVIKNFTHEDWKEFAKEKHGTLITNLRNKPRTIRVDDVSNIGMSQGKKYPDVIHLTPKFKDGTKLDMKEYGNLCAKLTKAKRAVKSRAIPKREDQKLVWTLAEEIQRRKEIRGATKWVDISFTSRRYLNTGLRWDISQHASYLPALTSYLRFMLCTSVFEHSMNYKFKDKSLLKVALTHPSHMDTASYSAFIWNMLQNVGKQYPHVEKRQRKVPLIGAKKKGVIYMTNLMANLYQEEETRSPCRHNERLEFLGDAILDYVSSLHLFLMFPEKGPGKLTAFRSGIVQTEHLADLSKKIGLDQFILVQHRVAELNKSESYLGNALEAVVGAVFLDGGITAVDNLLSFLLFIEDVHLCKVWNNLKKHPLQEEQPETDRHMIEKSDVLKRFVHLENQIGIEFKHIRLLAKAFTQSVHGLHDPKLTGGNYERLEFLGDAILKYVSSDYLYRHFPTHQEGHLTLLRSSLVNSRCLAQAARELGLNNFIIFQSYRESAYMKEKVCSDVFEALLGALHIEKGFEKGILYCNKLVEVCILSRLKEFIINQEWLDSKSQLQQCCHSLRDPSNPLKEGGKDYFHPVYKRLKYQAQGGVFYFKVAVYVNGKKLGVGEGRSTKEAEKEAAKQALMNNYFEQYAQQKRIIYRKFGSRQDQQDDESASDEGEAVEVPKRRFLSDEDEDGEDDDGEHASEEERKGEIPEISPSTTRKRSSIKREDELSIRRKHSREPERYASRYREERHRSSSSRTRDTRDSSRRSSRSKSPRRRYHRSQEKSPRKRSREREENSPSNKRKKRDEEPPESSGNKEKSKDKLSKPQMEISLDRWIKEKNSVDDPTTKQREALSGLDLEAVSSSDNGEEMLEAITSSENGEEMGDQYDLVNISSSELESDLDQPRSKTADVKEEFDFEKLNEEMEKELKNLNSVEKKEGSRTVVDDDLDNIELDDIDLGDIDDHFGDDELEEEENSTEKAKDVLGDDKDGTAEDRLEEESESGESDGGSSSEAECEFQEVDVWEEEQAEDEKEEEVEEEGVEEEDDDDDDDDDVHDDDDDSSIEISSVILQAEEITPDIDDISLDTGDLPLEPDIDDVSPEKETSHLELVSEDSLSEVEIY